MKTGRKPTHGMKHTPIYNVWQSMLQRCLNPGSRNYPGYGGKGIAVCDRWQSSFENFFADMGAQPQGLSLDRIDNAAGYSPENCRWATRQEQNQNKSTNLLITHEGLTLCVAEWSRRVGIGVTTIRQRFHAGYRSPEIFTTDRINGRKTA